MHKRILIADDHSAIRKGVKHILAGEFSQPEFGEAVNGPDALKQLRSSAWDLLILDVDLPGRNGLEILMQMKSERIGTPVLVFSFHREDEVAIRAFKSGAAGYLSKDTADKELVSAINEIMAGKKYISAFVAQQLVANLTPEDRPPHEKLTDREYQILLKIARGDSLKEIADSLALSVSAISNYRKQVTKKLGLSTNGEIMKYAISQNLI